MARNTPKAGKVLFAATALATTTLLGPVGAARADDADDAFVQYVQSKLGINGSRTELIDAGRGVCEAIDHGTTAPFALATTVRAKVPSITTLYDAAELVGAAVTTYCPANKNVINH